MERAEKLIYESPVTTELELAQMAVMDGSAKYVTQDYKYYGDLDEE
ncbi:MAG: hypothetical protein IKX60_02825 [Bacteroidales bacterium]|nr:hypothetical protein [Bacteroidales bacterium]